MLPKIVYWNIWEQSRSFVIRENKSENAYLTCKCYILINISHGVIFDIWHVRDIQYVLLLPLSAPPAFSKVIILFHTAQKMKFPIKDSSVNVTKSTRNCGFCHIYWRNPSVFVQSHTLAHIYNVLSHFIKGPLYVSWPEHYMFLDQIILIF